MNRYTFHINIYDVAFLGLIFIMLTFGPLLWFSKKEQRPANRFLAVALIIAALWITRLLGINVQLATYLPH